MIQTRYEPALLFISCRSLVCFLYYIIVYFLYIAFDEVYLKDQV